MNNCRNILRRDSSCGFAIALLLLLLACLAFLMSAAGIMLGQQTNRETFPSAEQASLLYTAVKDDDEASITRILGGGKDLVSSGDDLEDKHERRLFAQKYEEMHRLVEEPDGTTLLYVGAENWPFPIPLMSNRGA